MVRRSGTAVTVASRGSTASVVDQTGIKAGAGVIYVVDTALLPFYSSLDQVRSLASLRCAEWRRV